MFLFYFFYLSTLILFLFKSPTFYLITTVVSSMATNNLKGVFPDAKQIKYREEGEKCAQELRLSEKVS